MMSAPTARELAAQFGLHRVGREWRGPCPVCSYAGAFALTDGSRGSPIGWCASCRDQAAIAVALTGGSKAGSSVPREKNIRDATGQLARAEGILRGAVPVATSPIAVAYLNARRIGHLAACADLHFRDDCPHPTRVRLPAIIAAVRDAGGKLIGIHRTFVRGDGSTKADIEPPRASLGPVRGGAVRLVPLEDVLAVSELVVGEGIETSASAGLLLGLPAWAAVSAGNLGSGVVLPQAIRRVVIAADNDAPDEHGRRPGQDAARAAWFRFRREGRAVRIAMPDPGRGDFNDVLLSKEARR
jgi:phage/plasmid primase-like uncharacterized protein